MLEHFEVIVVGAGLSGIGAACHLERNCPGKSYVVLEARDAIGGTWDLFRYPGVRSDSDMFTLGYHFKPWRHEKAIADGASILEYVRETARDYGVEAKVRFGKRVTRIAWSSERALWTVDIAQTDAAGESTAQLTCRFVYMAPGYFAYDKGYTPELEGAKDFAGRIVHPQHWTEDIDYAGKRVVVIGSGATAMTLVPELAKRAAHVVLLQRSPTYVVSVPGRDLLATRFRQRFSPMLAYAATRWKNVLLSSLFFQLTQVAPKFSKRLLLAGVTKELPGYDVATHFTPRYNVWDQRLCAVPDGDLFDAIRGGRASMVTDHIDRLTQAGVRLRSGKELEADIIVTATGLQLLFLGGAEVLVDGQRVDLSRSLSYKGSMFTDVPNLTWTFGYTNASWTLKADLIAEYVCRLLKHMDAIGATHCTPRRYDPTLREEPWVTFTSSYIERSIDQFPKQGSKRPFRRYQNYVIDLLTLRFGKLQDSALEFGFARAGRKPVPNVRAASPGPRTSRTSRTSIDVN